MNSEERYLERELNREIERELDGKLPMPRGEMRCKWCQRTIVLDGDEWVTPLSKSNICAAHTIATWHVPAASSAIEVDPQDYNDMLPGRDFAERAYNKAQRPSVAPGEQELSVEGCREREEFARKNRSAWPDNEGLSVAPGEAQRELKCRHCGKPGKTCETTGAIIHATNSDFTMCGQSFSPSPAVPSEVAPGREQRLEQALRNMERVIVEVYPGHVEPDDEHLEEYKAVWNAVMTARAALEGK